MEIGNLCQHWQELKRREEEARKQRLLFEADLLDLIPHKLEGTETTTADGYKISITTKLTRKLDFAAYKALALPDNLAFVTYKPEIDLKKLRAVEMVDPALVALCVTSSPAKASIKIEEVL